MTMRQLTFPLGVTLCTARVVSAGCGDTLAGNTIYFGDNACATDPAFTVDGFRGCELSGQPLEEERLLRRERRLH